MKATEQQLKLSFDQEDQMSVPPRETKEQRCQRILAGIPAGKVFRVSEYDFEQATRIAGGAGRILGNVHLVSHGIGVRIFWQNLGGTSPQLRNVI